MPTTQDVIGPAPLSSKHAAGGEGQPFIVDPDGDPWRRPPRPALEGPAKASPSLKDAPPTSSTPSASPAVDSNGGAQQDRQRQLPLERHGSPSLTAYPSLSLQHPGWTDAHNQQTSHLPSYQPHQLGHFFPPFHYFPLPYSLPYPPPLSGRGSRPYTGSSHLVSRSARPSPRSASHSVSPSGPLSSASSSTAAGTTPSSFSSLRTPPDSYALGLGLALGGIVSGPGGNLGMAVGPASFHGDGHHPGSRPLPPGIAWDGKAYTKVIPTEELERRLKLLARLPSLIDPTVPSAPESSKRKHVPSPAEDSRRASTVKRKTSGGADDEAEKDAAEVKRLRPSPAARSSQLKERGREARRKPILAGVPGGDDDDGPSKAVQGRGWTRERYLQLAKAYYCTATAEKRAGDNRMRSSSPERHDSLTAVLEQTDALLLFAYSFWCEDRAAKLAGDSKDEGRRIEDWESMYDSIDVIRERWKQEGHTAFLGVCYLVEALILQHVNAYDRDRLRVRLSSGKHPKPGDIDAALVDDPSRVRRLLSKFRRYLPTSTLRERFPSTWASGCASTLHPDKGEEADPDGVRRRRTEFAWPVDDTTAWPHVVCWGRCLVDEAARRAHLDWMLPPVEPRFSSA